MWQSLAVSAVVAALLKLKDVNWLYKGHNLYVLY